VNCKDFGAKLKYWAQHGFRELNDMSGSGIGRTTWEVIYHKSFDNDPQQVTADA
jgi:hypothetical protein